MGMYLIDVKKLYFYAVSFVSLLILAFSLFGAVSNLARFYWFKTGSLVSYQPPFVSSWVPWNTVSTYSSVNVEDPYNTKLEEESLNVANTVMEIPTIDDNIKNSLISWQDSYEFWKTEQTNLQKSMTDNIITNLSAFVIFLPIFLFHLYKAMKLDSSTECECGGECDCDHAHEHDAEFHTTAEESENEDMDDHICECGGNCGCGGH